WRVCMKKCPSTILEENKRRRKMRLTALRFGLLAGCLLFAGVRHAAAQENTSSTSATPAQIVALDECDPATFNAVLGTAFCHNVTLGAFTTLSDLFAKAAAGTPDPGWDFE